MICSRKKIPQDYAEKIVEILVKNKMIATDKLRQRAFVSYATKGGMTEWRLWGFGERFFNSDDGWRVSTDYKNFTPQRAALIKKVNAELEELWEEYSWSEIEVRGIHEKTKGGTK